MELAECKWNEGCGFVPSAVSLITMNKNDDSTLDSNLDLDF